MIYIITQFRAMALAYAREHDIAPTAWTHIGSLRDREKLMGIENPKVVWISPYPEGAHELEQLVQSRTRTVHSGSSKDVWVEEITEGWPKEWLETGYVKVKPPKGVTFEEKK